MRLSVVVPTRDRPDRLAPLLTSVRRAIRDDDEVLVVDSASRRPVPAGAGVRVLRAARPGASLARNLGWQAATADVVAFVDDDCTVDAGWADAVRAAMADPALGFLVGRVEVPADQAGRAHPVGVRTDTEPVPVTAESAGTIGGSNNLAVRRSALEAVGGFDERLGPGTWFAAAEDLDLIDRLLQAGWAGRYEPAALVWHDQWRGRRELLALDFRYGKGQGARLARLRSRDPAKARRLAREVFWTTGLAELGQVLRLRYRFGVASVLVRTAGTLVALPVALGRLRRGQGR